MPSLVGGLCVRVLIGYYCHSRTARLDASRDEVQESVIQVHQLGDATIIFWMD